MDIESNRSSVSDARGEPIVTGVGQPVVQPVVEPVVQPVQPVVAAPYHAETVRRARYGSFSPAALIAGIVAVVLLILGGITVARGGFDKIDDPINVAGTTATTLLGLIELGFGLLLLIAALSRAREAIMLLGILGAVAAFVAVFQPTNGHDSLRIERGFAVVLAIALVVVVLSALLPTFSHSSAEVERV